MSERAQVYLLQEYVPAYRDPFFKQLSERLAARGVALTVLAGEPGPGQARRKDAVPLTGRPYRQIRQCEFRLLRRRVVLRALPVRELVRADVVVAEQARRNLDTYLLLLLRGRRPTVLWGHGEDYVVERGWFSRRLLQWLTRRAARLMVYTPGGADRVVESGISRRKVTVVYNATDTSRLEPVVAPGGPDILFLGSIDESKRLDWLWNAFLDIEAEFPQARVHVIGEGPDRAPWRTDAEASSRWQFHGRLTGADLSAIAQKCRCIVIPGRVGLVATEAFALGLPIVTSRHSMHAPEFEYLVHNVNALVAPAPPDLASYMRRLLRDDELHARLVAGARAAAIQYSIESYVEHFADGLVQTLELAECTRKNRSRIR
jgi:glycosyltransferase involved in cell wall biosynthesis